MDSTEQERETPRPSPAPRRGLQLMALLILALAGLSVFSNYQRAHRAEIDVVAVKILPPPTPRPTASLPPQEQ